VHSSKLGARLRGAGLDPDQERPGCAVRRRSTRRALAARDHVAEVRRVLGAGGGAANAST
jgi:hypothetical protein